MVRTPALIEFCDGIGRWKTENTKPGYSNALMPSGLSE